MMTEDWKPRYSDGQNEDGQNRERRPYNANRTNSYGNQGRPSYGKYERKDDGGFRPRPTYNRDANSGYGSRPSYGNNYERTGGSPSSFNRSGSYDRTNSYERPSNYERPNNYERPQRNYYDNAGSTDYSSDGQVKKRRARVGDAIVPGRSTSAGGYSNYPSQNPRPQNTNYPPRRTEGGYYNNNNNSRPRPFNKPANSGAYNPNAKYGVQKQLKYREENFDPNEPLRLNKYLANAGVCSRREADEFIKAGLVKVNGELVQELGTKVKRADEVRFHDDPVKLEHKIYLLLNKPKNCVTSADDPQERLTVMDLVKTACQERIFPVGRLDRNTTGVLLLTNDGDLSSKLTHPKYLKKKIYHVWLDKEFAEEDMQKLADGIQLEDGEIHADAISYVNDEYKDQVGIEIHSGKNRVVRRMFESLGYHVTKLDRVYFAGLTKKNLKKGRWRFLTDHEVAALRNGSFD